MKKNISLALFFTGFFASAQQIGDGFAANISNLTQPIKSGIYQVNSLRMNPDESYSWYHLFVMRHSNENNNHQLQLSSSYTENDRLFFRKLANSSGQNWYEVATRGANNFVGNQFVDGNVGIGTANPSYKLDVKGDVLFQGAIISSVSDVIGGQLQIKNPLKTSNGSASSWNIYNMTGGYGNSLQFWAYDDLGCAGGLCSNRFTIMDNGNVGIGELNPKNKLDVNGIIHSKEVKVDMEGWSDFVFKKEYNLPTLKEVEKHIAEKGHLENIPSEKEVLQNGISLGEMNAKLLQKIEELTLYLLKQDKSIEDLKIEVNNLKNQNK